MAANWADLNHDLIVQIARRISSIGDFVFFGSVCRSWRSAATRQNFSNLADIPHLMLTNDDENSASPREFYSLHDDRVRELTLPEANGKSCFSSRGWIFTVARDMEVRLLNPSTRHQIELPSLTTLPGFEAERLGVPERFMPSIFISKAVLSADPCSAPSDYVVMIVHGSSQKLAFYNAGAEKPSWTVIDAYFGMVTDVIYHEGRFYAADCGGSVLVCDVNGPNPTAAEVLWTLPRGFVVVIEKLYLVELSGKLLMVVRQGTDIRETEQGSEEDTYGTTRFQVLELNESSKTLEEVHSIGHAALFLGDNSTFSVNVHFTPCKPNCIYFTDEARESYHCAEIAPNGGGKDMGVYNLLDGSIEPHFKGQSRHSLLTPPLWVVLPPTF